MPIELWYGLFGVLLTGLYNILKGWLDIEGSKAFWLFSGLSIASALFVVFITGQLSALTWTSIADIGKAWAIVFAASQIIYSSIKFAPNGLLNGLLGVLGVKATIKK